MTLRQSFSLGRVFGIEVRVHATWLLAFAFVTWGLADGYFRFIVPRQGLGFPLLLGALSALLLFASVLVHEFSHSLVARALGMRVRNITLFIFGGVSNIGGEAVSARNEFLISIVGPLTSLALAAIFWLAAPAVGGTTGVDLLVGPARGLRGMTPLGAILNYLASVNLLLGVFNLLPAFPLDGGRVFRSVLWAVTHRFDRATQIATLVGQGFGFLMIGLGLVRMFFGDLAGGVWTIFIGWFLSQAAGAARRDRQLRESLRGVKVRQLMIPIEPRIMEPTAFSVSPETDAAALLDRLDAGSSVVPVIDQGQLVGGVDVARVLQFAQLHAELQQQAQSRGRTNPATAA
jgi:Zn-dependent protease